VGIPSGFVLLGIFTLLKSNKVFMADFLSAYTRLMRTVNRPLTEVDVLAEAKAAINDAVIYLQRDHAFSHTESLAQFTYPANELYVDLGEVCAGLLRDVVSLQQARTSDEIQGKPIKIMTYSQLQTRRRKLERSRNTDNSQIYDEQQIGFTIEDSFRPDLIAFIMGNKIGLYPKPTTAKEMLIHLHIWIVPMANSTDTNFFLDYAADVVHMLALKKLMFALKLDSSYPYKDEEVKSYLAGLAAWDSQIMMNPNTSQE